MRSAATFELRVPAGNNAPFTGIFGASSVGVVRCVPLQMTDRRGICLLLQYMCLVYNLTALAIRREVRASSSNEFESTIALL